MKTATTSMLLGVLLGALAPIGCDGSSSGPDEIEPLSAPIEGTWDGQAVTLEYGFAASTEGLDAIWSSGVEPASTPLAVVLSTAEVSCETDLGARNPPQGYSLVLLFPNEGVGAESSDQQTHSYVDGWINSGGLGGTPSATLTAVEDGSFGGSMDLQDDVSFTGDFTVPACSAR